jgi:protein-disulfide isomerase
VSELNKYETEYIKTGKVMLVYRDFPLDIHQNAQKAAEAAKCADEQGKYWEYHNMLFDNQKALDISSLMLYAKQLTLNETTFNECLNSGRMAQRVQKDLNDGLDYGVSGTPTFFINGIELVGAQPYSIFKQVIDKELNK